MNTTNQHACCYLSIIILTKHRHKSMLRTLYATHAQIPPDTYHEIIVIEETNLPQPVNEEGVRYFSIPEEGLGFGFVRNLALAKARGEIIVFLDDDVVPSENWLTTLLAPIKDEKIGAVGGTVLPDLSEINAIGKCVSFLGFPAGGLKRYVESEGRNYESNLISTGNCAFRADLAHELGGFDVLLRWGGEDQEFFSRISSRKKILFVPEAIVFHRQRDSLKQVFFWFVRRGKADFYRTCKAMHPLHSLIFPLRSNFLFKLLGFALALLGLAFVSGLAALTFILFAPVIWNVLLWNRGYKVLRKTEDGFFSKEIEQIRNAVLSKEVKWSLFCIKFTMDIGEEIGRLIGFWRYLKHRIFSKPLVLTFHHLGPPKPDMNALNSRYHCPKEKLQNIIENGRKEGRLILSLFELIKRLKENTNSLYFEKILVVTFDDGYLSIFEALKELAATGNYPFTIFIPTALVGNTNQWDQLKGLKKEKLIFILLPLLLFVQHITYYLGIILGLLSFYKCKELQKIKR